MRRTLVMLLAVTSAALASERDARAGSAEAQALFDEGKRLVAEGRIDEGCARFEKSQRIEPAGGTVLHLAACRESQGRLATAWELFHAALSDARRVGRKDREEAATQRLAAIEPRLSRLRIVVPRAARVSGLAVRRDDTALAEPAWDVPVPVDPGEHVVRAEAPSHDGWETRVRVDAPGRTIDVVVPALREKADDAPAAASAEPAPEPPPTAGGLGGQRLAAVVAGGVGVVGIGLGTYFYVDSVDKKSAADELCGGPAPTPCPEEGVAVSEEAHAAGTRATVAFGIGLAGLAVGAALWFLAPPSSRAALRPGSVAVRF